MRATWSFPCLLLLATGCPNAESTDKPADSGSDVYDVDGDGYTGDQDCNEEDGTIHVGAAELCDGLDNDCNGETDDGATDFTTFYADTDGDGYGDGEASTAACAQPDGYVAEGGDCNDADTAYHPGADEADCTDPEDYNCDGTTGFVDGDGDTFAACEDCDDSDATVNPAAAELCNGIDDDCNDVVDDNAPDAAIWYEDADADGFGSDTTQVACDQPTGFAMYGGDCDDANARFHPGADELDCTDPNDYNCDGSVGYADADGDGYAACTECDDADATHFPGATEYCDGVDDNCDGAIDEDSAVDASTWYADTDGDGFGDLSSFTASCSVPTGYTADSTDCDDTNGAAFPSATELCNGIDDNCDAVIDEDAAADALTWYADADHDGYGDLASTYVSCVAPSDFLADNTDCDDTNASTFPGADEYCDGEDDNCDGVVDEDTAVDATTWYSDSDGDTFGDLGNTWVSCSAPAGYVADATDCNDADNAVSPLGVEMCNGIDDNCDSVVDEDTALDALSWFADEDGDSYGDPAITLPACEAPAGFVSDATDCDDSDATEFPGATEHCDGDDDNCDGVADEDTAAEAAIWYADTDGDSFGFLGTTDVDCYQPTGFVADSTDCNDAVFAINPAAIEACDTSDTDEDCNGLADDADTSATGKVTWYADSDADTYGNAASTVLACDLPAGFVADNTDCNDAINAINPAATEICDAANTDENCNGLADNTDSGATGTTRYYLDGDSDGFGVASTYTDTCDLPTGYQVNNTDCDDANAAINPAAAELCDASNTDEDCDLLADDADSGASGKTDWYADADVDGYGAGTAVSACDQPTGRVASSTDCNDVISAINPGATEVCDAFNIDEDCDSLADNFDSSATGKSTFYTDGDSDGYGDLATAAQACDASASQVTAAGDCDDTNYAFNPSAAEICDAANADEDCDTLADDADSSASGQTSWYADSDSDTWGNPAVGTSACDAPTGNVANFGDCDDTNSAISPAGTEICDDLDEDEDCDGLTDDDDSSVLASTKTTWYLDGDSDEYGVSTSTRLACDQPSGYFDEPGDCDDTNNAVNPGVSEVCNNQIDDDCNGSDDGCSHSGQATTLSEASAYWYGSTTSDGVGGSSGYVGDVDNDGSDDIFFGTYQWDITASTDVGRAWLYSGATASGANALASTSIGLATVTGVFHNSAKDYVGQAVSGAGDFDDDGYLDVLVGASNLRYLASGGGAAGEAVVYSMPTGALDRNSASAVLTVQGTAASWYVGYSVSGGMDVDGDEVDDALVGAYGYDVTASGSEGSAGYYTGGSSGTSAITAATAFFTGGDVSEQAGQVSRMVDDVTGDGLAELAISAYKWDGTVTDQGRVYLVFGDAAIAGGALSSVADVIYTGPTTGNPQLGRSLSAGGDMDGDGSNDLWLGADQATVVDTTTRLQAGTAYLFTSFGSSSQTYADAFAKATGAVASDFFGRSIAGDGDLDGDGNADVAIGASSYDTPFGGAGGVFCWYGPLGAGTHSAVQADASFTGMAASDALGGTVSFAGDTNADGTDDLLISAINYDAGGVATNYGGVFLVPGGGY